MINTTYNEELALAQPIVIDNGSSTIKAGFAGDEKPKCIIPSYVGRPKHKKAMIGGLEGDFFVGTKAEDHRCLLSLKYPINNGVITDWLDMEAIWHQVFADLKANSDEHPILLTETALNPKKNREKMGEIFFESFNTPALFFSIQAILSLIKGRCLVFRYSTGRTTGIVLDSGDGTSHVVPIVEGFAIPNSIVRSDVAGGAVTNHLQHLLRINGVNLLSSSERELVKTIKESVCAVSPTPLRDEFSITDRSSQIQYTLPDGQVLNIGAERFAASEVLFKSSLINSEQLGVADLMSTSLSRCTNEVKKTLYENILLSGGNTLLQGFGERMLNEIKRFSSKETRIKMFASHERMFATFTGASIVSSLTSFKNMWITKRQYEEEGEYIFHQKCF